MNLKLDMKVFDLLNLQQEIQDKTGCEVCLYSEDLTFHGVTQYSDIVTIMKILEPHLE